MEGAGPVVRLGVAGPAFGTPDQQYRAADLVPDDAGILEVELVRRADADVVVELPGVGLIVVPASALQREVAG